MSLKRVRRSKSGAHEYQEEEEGKTEDWDGCQVMGRGALLRKASRRFKKQW